LRKGWKLAWLVWEGVVKEEKRHALIFEKIEPKEINPSPLPSPSRGEGVKKEKPSLNFHPPLEERVETSLASLGRGCAQKLK
jgi:hypothetical protein